MSADTLACPALDPVTQRTAEHRAALLKVMENFEA